ncbi:MAG TPA: class I SAM-dependent methyltransferase [Rhodocyclaceae bacterium]|jgi:cephalosporin hydroxylase|nr:class I SAM-dependent methyltransferase [Rhodocyclaceae bacterium]
MQISVLVFPANMPKAIDFARMVRGMGFKVVCASSEPESVSDEISGLAYLPYVTAPTFREQLTRLMDEENISIVYAPHAAVWQYMQELKSDTGFTRDFRLCNAFVGDENWRPYEKAYAWAESCRTPLHIHGKQPPSAALQAHQYAGLYHAYNAIPGESDAAKIWLLAQIARVAPKGNIVEIGSAYGRSAFSFAWLARSHRIGTLVCVDPWSYAASENQGADAQLINTAVKSVAWEQVFGAFLTSLSGFDDVAYIRKPSVEALPDYVQAKQAGFISTPEFGRVALSDGISILHIDGNHSYEDAVLDIQYWTPHVQPGGWILIDDYVWAFGDGPQRAADELLQRQSFEIAFAVGDTLCIQV